MFDISLMQYLLKAIPSGSHLILVGDADQLSSFGPGNVTSSITYRLYATPYLLFG